MSLDSGVSDSFGFESESNFYSGSSKSKSSAKSSVDLLSYLPNSSSTCLLDSSSVIPEGNDEYNNVNINILATIKAKKYL